MKILILVLSSQERPWKEMINTSMHTWDSKKVDNVETIFYCGNPIKPNTDKVIYFKISEAYATIGHKNLQAFKWVIDNKEFDYVARVNSSCYVDKEMLYEYCKTLPETVFSGIAVDFKKNDKPWMWGGGQYIISRDIFEDIVRHKNSWNHMEMEDVAMSQLVYDLGYKFHDGKACSINLLEDGSYSLLSYNGESYNFNKFSELKREHHFYRVKQDLRRYLDKDIMQKLSKLW